jgi:hypothetical protein
MTVSLNKPQKLNLCTLCSIKYKILVRCRAFFVAHIQSMAVHTWHHIVFISSYQQFGGVCYWCVTIPNPFLLVCTVFSPSPHPLPFCGWPHSSSTTFLRNAGTHTGSLYCVTVQLIIMKKKNVIWIFSMTLYMCPHNLTVHLYEHWKGYKRTLQQRIPCLWVHQFWCCQCQAHDSWELCSSGLLHSE